MSTYIVQRLLMALVVLLIVSVLIFVGMRLLPGDPILMKLTQSQQQNYSEEQIAQTKHEIGLDRPIVVQYGIWLAGIMHGDFGISIMNQTPVTEEIFRRIPITLHLGLTAFIISLILGIPGGIICAVRRGTAIDTMVTSLSVIGITVPVFWLGFLLIYVFSLHYQWLPVQGYTSPFENWWLSIKQTIMPIICLSLFPIASVTRQTRSSMLEVMRGDYIRTAWSKGLKERIVIIRHGLKNALIPVVTLSGMGLSMIIGGSVIVETVFNVPGMGRLAVTSIINKDYPYVQGIILIISIMVLSVNLLVDLTYGWLDPRIRFNKSA